MKLNRLHYVLALVLLLPALATADELTQMVQQDLVSLGYEPGATNGEMTTATIVAISKFQAEHDLQVTGEVTPQLAGVLKATIKKQSQPAAGPPVNASTAPPAPTQAELQAAQQACLQQKMAEAQAGQQKKRAFGRMMSAVTRTAFRTGNYDLARTANDVYAANATADDLAAAAKDLGLTQDAVEACQNP
jgi:hypothetical protein